VNSGSPTTNSKQNKSICDPLIRRGAIIADGWTQLQSAARAN
jgi:hypothetical protein